MVEILVVCSGNICRSPVLERMLRRRLGPEVNVSSAGTLGLEGYGAYEVCEDLGPEFGIDLSDHVSRGVDEDSLVHAKVVIVLEPNHGSTLLARFGERFRSKIRLASEYLPEGFERSLVFTADPPAVVSRGSSIPDPMGAPEDEVRPVLQVLELAAEGLARAYRSQRP